MYEVKIKHLYVYVPPCPRCGSYKTGEYFSTTSISDAEKRIAWMMKKGTYVKYRLGFSNADEPNFFCNNCGIEWMGNTTYKFLTKKEINEEKIKREINNEDIYRLENSKDISRKEKRKNKRKAVINKMAKMFSHHNTKN